MKECKKCGECCRYIVVSFVGDIDHEWASAHNIEVSDNLMVIRHQCKYLDYDNKCLVHSKKPKSCSEFPGKYEGRPFIPKGCVYEKET